MHNRKSRPQRTQRDTCVLFTSVTGRLAKCGCPGVTGEKKIIGAFSAFGSSYGKLRNSTPRRIAMPDAAISGSEFKKQLRAGSPKMGLFLNAHSPTVAEQLAHSGYDWLLVDSQHGPMGYETLSSMLAGIAMGGAKSLVRVA